MTELVTRTSEEAEQDSFHAPLAKLCSLKPDSEKRTKRIPLVSCLPRTSPITHIKNETVHVKTFTFPVSFGAKPGQFLMVWLPGVDEVPMSIAMDDGKETKITFFDIGDTTKALFRCNRGDLVGLRGPFGTQYEWQPQQHLILVAGGYGAAPMYFVAVEAIKDGCTIDFIVGARSKEHLLYLKEVKGLSNTTLHIATDDGSMGHKGYNTEVLEGLLLEPTHSTNSGQGSYSSSPSRRRALDAEASLGAESKLQPNTSVFACGPEMMMKRISDICAERNVDCSMSLERYMKCGYGLCGNCTMDPVGLRVCIDGPVVKNALVQKLTEFGKYHRDDLGKKYFFSAI